VDVDVDREGERARRYGVSGIPAAVLVDSSGQELARPRHPGSMQELERALAAATSR
jgi:hypothetical protein